MKDLGEDNIVHLDRTIRINHPKPKPDQFTRADDIIFRSRGLTNTAALQQEDAKDVIVAAPLFRLRPDTKKIMPEYLLWWINQQSAQAYFRSNLTGTSVMMISRQCLAELEVHLPPLAQQRMITEYFSLSRQELRLLEAIKNHRMLHTQGILMKMASMPH